MEKRNWNKVFSDTMFFLNTIFALIFLAIITLLAVFASIRLFLIQGIGIPLAIFIVYFNSVMSYFLMRPFIESFEDKRGKNEK